MEENDLKLSSLNRVMIGGSAVPRTIVEKFEKNYGVTVTHGWGMTEMSPLGSFSAMKPGMEKLPYEEQLRYKLKQGRAPYMVEMKVIDDDGKELPRDGESFGRLVVRGPAIARSYFKGEGGQILDEQGFFDTGDVAHIDGQGFMQITDRAKDVIKSGGEWISSIEIENLAVGHPKIAEAAVIGVAHPKWDERPLLICVRAEGADVEKDDVLKFLAGKIAKWWMPDDVAFVDEIPHTATGKIQKRALRDQFADYELPTAK
jgi:fatty-acyl-CoA synthase